MLGCTMRPAPDLGGWVPARSASFETSLPNIYAVGDGAGIGGVEVALLEGRLAAEAILGREPDPDVARRYARLDRFRHALSRAYQPAAPLKAAEPETIICRCEELRLAELERHAGPDRDLARVKASTRLGMGRCQGRNCLSSAATLLGLDEAELATPPRTRPPIRPVRIGDVLIDKDTGPAREPDEIAPSFEGVHAT
jgi:hypothetical protein